MWYNIVDGKNGSSARRRGVLHFLQRVTEMDEFIYRVHWSFCLFSNFYIYFIIYIQIYQMSTLGIEGKEKNSTVVNSQKLVYSSLRDTAIGKEKDESI